MDISPEQLEAALATAETRINGMQETINTQATQITELQKKTTMPDAQWVRFLALGTPTAK